ncbi:hypothetical protein [Bradyrhizobium sp. Tv2a-2]|uniref:hypothetical protein n=1 Tax=Bradyrhizobium sp. Tv2a-2 TaxID=113395 RepID=UPI0004666CAB|nr:hypothetical protein [Bradyrhizobium sp. Tv2a-2]
MTPAQRRPENDHRGAQIHLLDSPVVGSGADVRPNWQKLARQTVGLENIALNLVDVIGYHKSNASPILAKFMSRLGDLTKREAKAKSI